MTVREIVRDKAVQIFEEQILRLMRENLFTRQVASMPGAGYFINVFKYVCKLDGVKAISSRMPQFDPAKNSWSWLPTAKTIEVSEAIDTQDIAIPLDVLDYFIEKTSHRVVVDYCACRLAGKCEHHDTEIGCLMMGESATLIPTKSRRELDVDQAKAHVRKAIANGLVPLVGKVRIDNDIFMIPDRGKLLTVCLCCACCCVMKFSKHVSLETIDQMVYPVEGLAIEVTDDCDACGQCATTCYVDAIEVDGDRARISPLCRICGRCVSDCPEQAIKLTLDNESFPQDVIERIEAYVDVT